MGTRIPGTQLGPQKSLVASEIVLGRVMLVVEAGVIRVETTYDGAVKSISPPRFNRVGDQFSNIPTGDSWMTYP